MYLEREENLFRRYIIQGTWSFRGFQTLNVTNILYIIKDNFEGIYEISKNES